MNAGRTDVTNEPLVMVDGSDNALEHFLNRDRKCETDPEKRN